MHLKPVKPTARIKKRYIRVDFFEGKPENPKNWVIRRVKRILGIWGYSASQLKVIEEEPLIIEVERGWVHHVRAALLLDKDYGIATRVSGMISHLKSL